nr:2-oxo-hepta-3-ene-1,7-dioic acid hydratase [Rhodococcus wratislaviensis]
MDRWGTPAAAADEHSGVTDMIEASETVRPDLLAERLHHARRDRTLLDANRDATALSTDSAYAIQQHLTRLRLAEGRCHVGYKLGYTSAVMRRQMGVSAPNYGPLLDDMVLHDDAAAADFLHPRVEPEIGILLSKDLSGPDLMLTEVAAAVGEVRACLEIVDSIWQDYRFSAEQNTADGSSAAGVVLGPVLDIDPLHAHRIRLELSEDGTAVETAVSAAAAGHPLHGVAWLAGELTAGGGSLHKGELIITGGLTVAIPLRPGATVAARFGRSTTVRVHRPEDEKDADI